MFATLLKRFRFHSKPVAQQLDEHEAALRDVNKLIDEMDLLGDPKLKESLRLTKERSAVLGQRITRVRRNIG